MRRMLGLMGCVLLGIVGCSPVDHAPTAVLEASAWQGDPPLEVRFSAAKSVDDVGITQIEWDFGDGETLLSDRFTMSHVYAVPGSYEVRVIVVDEQGAMDEAGGTVVITNRVPVANFRATNDAPIVGEIVQFDASASYDPDGDPLMYSWSFGGRTASGERVSYGFSYTGLIEVTLTVEDGHGGCGTTSHEFNVLDPSDVVSGGCRG